MIGTIVNVVGILIGSSVGLIFRKGINDKTKDTVMAGLGLCVLFIGISGSLKGENTLVTIISIVVGAIIGEFFDFDDKLKKLSFRLEHRINKKQAEKIPITQGFITASLLFCVGAMTIMGSLQSGLTGNHEILFTKSLLDTISSVILASTLGIGVLFSAAFVLVYQGTITLLAELISPYLSDIVVAEMTCVGSLLIIALGLNLLKITNIKVINYIPAIFLPILLLLFM